ncbi:MAG: nucleotidyltransferase family protein [Candidatus Pacearchaeota archaeon]|jgi:NDP-sugar pyrophosphorylase family protein
MKAIILCAGKGERMRPLTKDIPKPLIPIDNKPVLEYAIKNCKKHGINEIAINTSYLPEKIKEYFGTGEKFGVKIRYSFEDELLGTSGALNNFRDFFNETFFIIYGDNITNLDLKKMLEFHKKKESYATLFIYKEKLLDEKTTPGAIVIDEDKRVIQMIENPTENEKKELEKIPYERKFINAGVYILEPEILKNIPEGFSDFAKDIFPKLIKNQKVYGYIEECYFKEVGQMHRYLIAKKDIESEKIKLD